MKFSRIRVKFNILKPDLENLFNFLCIFQGRVQYDLLLYDVSQIFGEKAVFMECDRTMVYQLITDIKKYKIRKKVYSKVLLLRSLEIKTTLTIKTTQLRIKMHISMKMGLVIQTSSILTLYSINTHFLRLLQQTTADDI